jgi:hypothetical protein
MSLFSEFLPQSGESGPTFSDPDVAWAEGIALSIRGMRDAARWMLGVVAGWFIVIPELSELRRLLPTERPIETVYLAALLLAVSVGRILITVLEVQAPANRPTYDLHNLDPNDLKYLQDYWGVMANPADPAEWGFQKGLAAWVWQAVRHMTPEEAQEWFDHNAPEGSGPVPLPTKADLLQFGEQVYWMRMDELRAVLLLSQREMARRYKIARYTLLSLGLTATFALIVLLGPLPP